MKKKISTIILIVGILLIGIKSYAGLQEAEQALEGVEGWTEEKLFIDSTLITNKNKIDKLKKLKDLSLKRKGEYEKKANETISDLNKKTYIIIKNVYEYLAFKIEEVLKNPNGGNGGIIVNNLGKGKLANATSENPIRRMTGEKIPLNLDKMRFHDNIPKKEYKVSNLSIGSINSMINKVASSGGGIIYLPAGTLRTSERVILKSNIKIIGAPNFGTKFRATGDIDGGFFKFGGLENVSVEGIDAGGAGIQDIWGNNKNVRITHNYIHDVKNHNGTGNYSSGNEHFEISYNHLKNIGNLDDWRVDTRHGCELRELRNSLILGNLFERCGMGAELSSGCINSGMIGNWMKNCGWNGKIINSTNSLVAYNDFEGGIFRTDDRDPWMVQGSEKNAIIIYNRFGIPNGGNASVWKQGSAHVKEFSYNILAGTLNGFKADIMKNNIVKVGQKYLTLPFPK